MISLWYGIEVDGFLAYHGPRHGHHFSDMLTLACLYRNACHTKHKSVILVFVSSSSSVPPVLQNVLLVMGLRKQSPNIAEA